jgi:hypothetical protein
MSKTRRPGRPAGSRTKSRDQAEARASRCRECGSTNRTAYRQKIEHEHGGHHHRTGEPFTHIVKRWTSCADCGQARIDITYENRPEG